MTIQNPPEQFQVQNHLHVARVAETSSVPVPKNHNETSLAILLVVSAPTDADIVTVHQVSADAFETGIFRSSPEECNVTTDFQNAIDAMRDKAAYYWTTHSQPIQK
jgi:hypothetical protein